MEHANPAHGGSANERAADQPAAAGSGFATAAPAINLPKGGGAIRSIGEKFAANPVTGTGSMSVPIATSPGRAGFGPELSLSYDSAAGNGPFGLGWNLALPSITRKTDKGLPQYDDAQESDVFLLSGAEDLVPVFRQDPDGSWVSQHPGFERDGEQYRARDAAGELVIHEEEIDGYRVRRYRPRIEGLFARIERWSRADAPADVHWRSISKDNILTLYGQDENSRIADPLDPTRIFSWLICESRDDKGNGIRYRYKAEDGAWQARAGQGDPFVLAHQRNRGPASDPRRTAQRYLQRVLYGNRNSLLTADGRRPRHVVDLPNPPTDTAADWLFEVRFDYGELDEDQPLGTPERPWFYRPDAFSSYRPGFELRTCRRCERVLMLHHIPDQSAAGAQAAQPGYDGVVSSTEFTYADELDPALASASVYSFLKQVVHSGWKQENGISTRRSLPPVEFDYSIPVVQDEVEEVDSLSLDNLPIALDGSSWRWTDLHGEGIPGILTEQSGAWFYKRNLAPLGSAAAFAPLETVALKPNASFGAGAQIIDLAGDGLPDLVVMDGPVPGFYEHDGEEGWQLFRPFSARLNRDFSDPNLKFIDLDGDGHADVLISEDDAFVWHASLGEAGFGPARRVVQALDEEKGPGIVFADGTQSIHLADLSGDGLTDIVRIRNGEVCYWPNLGYGRFGAKVTMDNAPWFDHPDQFNPQRIRLADIDGSGTTDLIYLHRDGVRLYFNQAGNSWSAPQQLKVFPRIDDLASIMPVDLLGNGTACLVWSSALPGDATRPMRYVNLMGGQKPHLLIASRNNLGAETRVHYAPSTRFYLQDRQDGKPWVSKLPFPVHVVERVETWDHISRSRFVSRYAYHHGYFDGEEREFRGFGMVEQWDTEHYATLAAGELPADNIAAPSHVPPVHTKTWFHTGAHLARERISRHHEGEYFRAPGLNNAEAQALLLPDTELPSGLSTREEHEACRALKGMMLRQEVYADDGSLRASIPYTVVEQNFSIRMLQACGDNRHAVFLAYPCEALSYHYERNAADPRVQHALTLEVDEFGNSLKEAAIGYGRRRSPLAESWDRAQQTTALITYTENRVTNGVDEDDSHRTPLPCETITWELTGYAATGQTERFQATDFVEPDPDAPTRLRAKPGAEIAYEASPPSGPCRRPIERLRTHYRRDDLSGLLPLGQLEALAIAGEAYKLAFTPGLLQQAYVREGEPLLPDPALVLQAEGGYVDLDGNGHWWIPSGRSYFAVDPNASPAAELAEAQAHFFLPRRYRDPFGHDSNVSFDTHDLLMTETRDALDNRVTVLANDYRVLQPRLVSDPNGNRSEAAFDTLGLVAGTAVMGKAAPAPVEGDALAGFSADLTEAQLDGFFDAADPHAAAAALLHDASTRIVYDVHRFWHTHQAHPEDPTQWQAAGAATIVRETHVSDLQPGQQSKLQLAFSYSDGFGREIQNKIQAEPGPLDINDRQSPIVSPRWVGSGWTIFNNKGKPIRQYEPFFSATHGFEFGVQVGVSPVLFYDPLERVVATLHPNRTWEKVVFDPWQQTTWDVNDTILITDPKTDVDVGNFFGRLADADYLPTWHALRTDAAQAAAFALRYPDPAARTNETQAARKTEAHAATPTVVHADALGRLFLTIAHNRVVCADHDLDGTEDHFATRVELDIEGNQRAVRDAIVQAGDTLGRIVMRYAYDMLGNRIQQLSMEAGARWMLNDGAGQPIRAWDSRLFAHRMTYDALRRPTGLFVTENGAERLAERTVYGEIQGDAANHRGQVYQHFDDAGVVTKVAYDFKGNLREHRRELLPDYKVAVNWLQNPAATDGTFTSRTTFDALNRPLTVTSPDGSVYQPTFNEANLLEKVDVRLRGAGASTAFVTDIDYNAKGQRRKIDYGNGARTTYEYDPLTFRLSRLKTTRPANPDVTASQLFNTPSVVQDLRYSYDPVGNITQIEDFALKTIVHAGQNVEPVAAYVYDAIYRLIEAQGREHIGQSEFNFNPSNGDYRDYPFVGRSHPNDLQALRNYTERYEYDPVGNFEAFVHRFHGGGWTRHYDYQENSLIEAGKKSSRLTRTTVGDGLSQVEPYTHDAHGNMTSMPHLTAMAWDFKDELQQVDLGGGGTAYYVYDSTGQRVRKVIESQHGVRQKERIYLGGFEIYREYNGAGVSLERESLHVLDDKQRIALVETQTILNGNAVNGPVPLQRYQLGNHLASASVELDKDGALIGYEEYHPYGTTSFQAGRSVVEVSLKRYRYTGKERDEESGLYYFGARYYSPWLARWTSCDPAEFVDGENLYEYVSGNPITNSDPTGEFGLPSSAEIVEAFNREKALAVARAGSHAMTGKATAESNYRDARELYAKATRDKSYKRPRVQSVLGGAFLRMYLDHKVDPSVVKAAGEEIKKEPEFKKLQKQIERKATALGKKLLGAKADDLLKVTTNKHLQYRLKHGGIAFRYETNPIIGGVSGAEVKSVKISQVETERGIRVDYEMDVTFTDTYDFDNKRSGAYDRYRKKLASHLAKGDYDKFWDAFERKLGDKKKTGLDHAQIFASFMYAIEKKGWTPGPLVWDVAITMRGSVPIPNSPAKKAPAETRSTVTKRKH